MSFESTGTVAAQAEALQQVSGFFRGILAEVSGWVPELASLFEDQGRPPRAKAVNAATLPLVAELVNGHRWPVVGAGFVAANSAIADTVWHMAWWQGEALEPLVLPSVAAATDAYVRREWFTTPMEKGEPHVTGPYVDFLCTDEYTMTMTVPVTVRGRSVGVAGADVFVESLEPLLLPVLRELDPAAALINHVGRVVISADPQVAAGTLLAPDAFSTFPPSDGGGNQAEPSVDTDTPRTVQPRGDWYAGSDRSVLRCDRLPLAVVHPIAADRSAVS
ncbi:PDC sensor domain-containing protein [Arthrobacter sp. D2-10]